MEIPSNPPPIAPVELEKTPDGVTHLKFTPREVPETEPEADAS
jgi:hypothetical protein